MKKILILVMSSIIMSSAMSYYASSSVSKDPYEKEKKEEISRLTLMPEESYLNYVVKIKTSLNRYVEDVRSSKKIDLENVQIKAFINTLLVKDQSMIINENLFKKENLDISVEKGNHFELVLNNLNENQCKTIIYKFVEDKFTSYIVLNNMLGNNLICKEKNTIKLSVF